MDKELKQLKQLMSENEFKGYEKFLTNIIIKKLRECQAEAFTQENDILKHKIAEGIKKLDKEFIEDLNKQYLNNPAYWIKDSIAKLKGEKEIEKSEDQIKWEDLINYVETRFK